MTSAGSTLSSGAFATTDAGSGYFATAEHYRHLANGVVDALYRGGVVLVSGDPTVCLPILTEALRKAAAPRAVIEISCGPDLDCGALYAGSGSAGPNGPTLARAEGETAERAVLEPPIYVFGNPDRLLEAQIDALLDAHTAPPGASAPRAGVLVATSSFASASAGSVPGRLKERLAAHLPVQRLDRDEIEAFIRYQLPPDGVSSPLTSQRVALITLAAGGDPAVVNRLAHRMLEQEAGADARPRARWRRDAASLKRSVAIIVCLGIFGLVVGAVGSRDLGGLLYNDRLERKDNGLLATGVPNQVVLPGGPVTPAAPSPAGDAANPPSRLRSPIPSGSRLPAEEIAALVARGDAFLGAGDIASARLFFQRAADAGDGRAAMRMAITFDPAFLERAGVHSLRGNPEQAAFWYQRARDLGEAKAERAITPSSELPSQPR